PEVPSAEVEAPAEQFQFTEPGLKKSAPRKRPSTQRLVPKGKKGGAAPLVWVVVGALAVGGGLFWWIGGNKEKEEAPIASMSNDLTVLATETVAETEQTRKSDPLPAGPRDSQEGNVSPNLTGVESGEANNQTRIDGIVANGQWQDVLQPLSTEPSYVTPTWESVDGELKAIPTKGKSSICGISTEPLMEYEARIRFTLGEDVRTVTCLLPSPQGGFALTLWDNDAGIKLFLPMETNASSSDHSGIVKSYPKEDLVPGKEYLLGIQIDDQSIEVELDGEIAIRKTDIDWNEWGQSPLYDGNAPILGLRVERDTVIFHSFEVRIPKGVSDAPGESEDWPTGPHFSQEGGFNAWSSIPDDPIIDLSRLKGVDDARELQIHDKGWIVLQQNGETVSSDGLADRTGIRDIRHHFHSRFTLIRKDGGIEAFDASDGEHRQYDPGHSLSSVVDCVVNDDHGLALLEDGSVETGGTWPGELANLSVDEPVKWFSRTPGGALAFATTSGRVILWTKENGRISLDDETSKAVAGKALITLYGILGIPEAGGPVRLFRHQGETFKQTLVLKKETTALFRTGNSKFAIFADGTVGFSSGILSPLDEKLTDASPV
ncbi:MAG: hypothetical protein AAGC68_16415, partial [Verrucomicrobiota bacterium]